MMYPRHELLRDLRSEDGSIWVTIDDNETHYVKVVMDEVLGRKNFVANVLWQKAFSPKIRHSIFRKTTITFWYLQKMVSGGLKMRCRDRKN